MIQHNSLLDLKISVMKIDVQCSSDQETGRLKDIKRGEIGYMSFITKDEFPDRFCRGVKFNNHRSELTNGSIYHESAISVPEWQLTVFLVIIINHIRIKIMQLYK